MQVTATVFIAKDGKTLFVNHKRLGFWTPPGGHVEEGETPDAAAIREAKEETGLDIMLLGAIDPKGNDYFAKQLTLPDHVQVAEGQTPEHHPHLDHVYFAIPVGGELKVKLDEAKEAKWFSKAELDKLNSPPSLIHFGKKAIDAAGGICKV